MGKVKEVINRLGKLRVGDFPTGHSVWEEVYDAEAVDAVNHRHACDHYEERIAAIQSAHEADIKRIANLESQINELASFIIREVPGEPSENQGAVDTAVRIIRKHQARISELEVAHGDQAEELAERNRHIKAQEALLNWRSSKLDELEAELAKRKELPPLPGEVREYVEKMREVPRTQGLDLSQSAKATLRWFDACYPRPVPQWEKDASRLAGLANLLPVVAVQEVREIAERVRGGYRG